MMIYDLPTKAPMWVYCRNLANPEVEEYSFFDFDYLAAKIQILKYYDIWYQQDNWGQNAKSPLSEESRL